jgi:hypothetical protein
MTMILESGEVCPYGHRCPLNSQLSPCYGTRPERLNMFECEYVVNGKLIADSGFRNPLDKTGRMKVIME